MLLWRNSANYPKVVPLASSYLSAVDNFFLDGVQLVKFGVPKNQKVYRYDYHVKRLIVVMIA